MLVQVLSKKGKPLMQTSRCGHVRWLLKHGKAVAVNNNPFTILLKYDTTEYRQNLTYSMDPGRKNIGDAVSDETVACVYLAELDTHNKSIKKQMADRRTHRSERRRHKRKKKQRAAIRNCNTIQNGDNNIIGESYYDGRVNKTCNLWISAILEQRNLQPTRYAEAPRQGSTTVNGKRTGSRPLEGS